MKFYQACYGKPDNSRWQTFNASEDLPSSLAGNFEKIGSSCTPDSAGITQTNVAKHQRIFEIRFNTEDNICAVLTAEYPGNDDQGRPKMFAHSFILDAAEAVMDLNNIIGISDANFKFDVESTKTVPSELIYNDRLTLDTALANIGISKDIYHKLIACVYILLEGQTRFPIYIVGKTDTDFVRNCIFSILSALPYPMRTFLQFANANVASLTKENKSILFVDKAPDFQKYFNIETGETNIDFSIIEHYPENFSMFGAFVNLDKSSFEKYCFAINETIKSIGFTQSLEYQHILTAEKFLHSSKEFSEKDNNEITVALSEFLRITYQNLFIDNFIAEIMKIYDERGILPNDDLIYKMEIKAANTQSVDFVEYYKRIRLRYLLDSGSEEIVRFLTKQYESKSIFDDWCYSLAQLPDGKQAIALFFEKRYLTRPSFGEIVTTFENAGEYNNYENVQAAIKAQCSSIANKLLLANEISKRDFNEVLDTYRSTTNMVLADCRTFNTEQAINEIKMNFWSRFSLNYFDFDELCVENCKLLSVIGSSVCDNADALVSLYDSLETYKQDSNFGAVEDAFKTMEKMLNIPETALAEIAPKIQKAVLTTLKRETYRHFMFWHRLACIGKGKGNSVIQMVEWNLPIVCKEEYFENALKESPRMQKNAAAILRLLVGEDQKSGAVAKFASSPDIVKVLKKNAKVVSEFIKRAEKDKKADEKERAKQEKEQAKREKAAKKEKNVSEDAPYEAESPLSSLSDVQTSDTQDSEPKKKGGLFGLFGKKKK